MDRPHVALKLLGILVRLLGRLEALGHVVRRQAVAELQEY